MEAIVNNSIYRVAKGVIRRPREPKSTRPFSTAADFINQGEIIPQGFLDETQIKSLLSEGRIEEVTAKPGEVMQESKRRGKWSVEPAGLVGKTLEDLLVMILEIDPEFDVARVQNEQEAVTQLTADWDPSFRETLSQSTDRSRPEQLGTKGIKNVGDRPMSEVAAKALERAKAKAQAQPPTPTTEGEASQG